MKKLLLGLIILFCTSCAPVLSSHLALYEMHPEQSEQQREAMKYTVPDDIKVGVVNDLRTQKVICDMDGIGYGETGNAALVIQSGVERYFSNNGYKIALGNAPTLSVDLVRWYTQVEPGNFITTVDSKAEIKISLLNKKGKIIYKSIYNGTYDKTRLFITQKDVEESHMRAMHFAINEASNDMRLRALIRASQH